MAFLNIEISKEVVKIESYEGKLQLHKLQKLQEKKKNCFSVKKFTIL